MALLGLEIIKVEVLFFFFFHLKFDNLHVLICLNFEKSLPEKTKEF